MWQVVGRKGKAIPEETKAKPTPPKGADMRTEHKDMRKPYPKRRWEIVPPQCKHYGETVPDERYCTCSPDTPRPPWMIGCRELRFIRRSGFRPPLMLGCDEFQCICDIWINPSRKCNDCADGYDNCFHPDEYKQCTRILKKGGKCDHSDVITSEWCQWKDGRAMRYECFI
jgi:hypothetical protein